MNRVEAAMLLEQRQLEWPATPQPPNAIAEVDAWAGRLAAFDAELVRTVVFDHVGQFGLTLSEVLERCQARSRPRPAIRLADRSGRTCPTCQRSPFGPHRGRDACRTCGRDDAPSHAHIEAARAALEQTA